MKSDKNKVIKYIVSGMIMLFIILIIYSFSSHKLVVMGQKNKIYYTGITELDLRKNRLSENEEKN